MTLTTVVLTDDPARTAVCPRFSFALGYYELKTIILSRVRMAMCRWFTMGNRDHVVDVRPIKPGPEHSPTVWPEGEKPGITPGVPLKVKIWIDLDNTPHVPFFIPVMRELERRGHEIVLTARDAFQVCELADQKGLQYIRIGRHHGRNRIMKVLGLAWRSLQLATFWLRHRPGIALSHGARSQIMLCNLLGTPTILISDYEHSKTPLLMSPRWEIVPDALPDRGLHSRADRLRKYRGIKEDVYAPDFKPDPTLLAELGLSTDHLIITVRPPANEAPRPRSGHRPWQALPPLRFGWGREQQAWRSSDRNAP